MRLRHKIGAEDEILNSPYCIHINDSEAINLANYFTNNNPLYLELGMGKGKFICEMAKQNPNINFIGIERYATVLLKAIKNYKNVFETNSQPLTNHNTLHETKITKMPNLSNKSNNNLYFLCIDVANLPKCFKAKSIDKIFLNFSDPWPKKRHENRRLTHHNFLSIYEQILKEDGILEFKTDNKDLFDFSLIEIKNSHFNLVDYTYDLHNDNKLNNGNIMTEYEEKFSEKGNPICKFIAKLI